MFLQAGEPHHLIVLSDLTRALREEERQAWRRLIRVLSHDINNSLAPIHSSAETLGSLLDREELPPDWREDMGEGLGIIGGCSESLRRFMASYARLARLPPPQRRSFEIGPWVERTVALETRKGVTVEAGKPVRVEADEDQLAQLLINVLRKAVDAALETGGGVTVRRAARDGQLDLRVEDEGPGVADRANLFVPFFTTKPQGSGIGLILAPQIAEAHGGSFPLTNREEAPGRVARLVFPLRPSPAESVPGEGGLAMD